LYSKIEKPKLDEKIDPNVINTLGSLTSCWNSERLKNRETMLSESYPRILPQWIKYDKKVGIFLTIGSKILLLFH